MHQWVVLKTAYKFTLKFSVNYQSFIYSPTDAPVSCLKINTKIYIKTAPTCFGVTVTPSSGRAFVCAYMSELF